MAVSRFKCNTEVIPLKEIASNLAQHIYSGTLFLTCCANEKLHSVDSAYLEVNGSAKRVSISQWTGKPARIFEETCSAA